MAKITKKNRGSDINMTEKEANAIRRCNELTNESHSCWIGLTNQEAIQTVIDMVLNQDKSICDLKNKVLVENNARNQAENKYEELLSKFSPIYDIKREKEIKKLKRMVDLMAEHFEGYEISDVICLNTKDEAIQYFEKKVNKK